VVNPELPQDAGQQNIKKIQIKLATKCNKDKQQQDSKNNTEL
jgi:hypothetical protein